MAPENCYTEPIEFEYANVDLLVPGKNGEIISRKGKVLNREKFEKMKDEFYELRGWDIKTGFQTKAKLRKLELHDIIEDLEKRGLVV